jgi:phospholipase C
VCSALSYRQVNKRPVIGSNITVVEEAVLNALTGTLDVGIPYPLPASNSMPSQETTPARPPVP